MKCNGGDGIKCTTALILSWSQVSSVFVQRLLLPKVEPGRAEQVLQELHQAATLLGAVPRMGGVPNERLSTDSRCINVDDLWEWLFWFFEEGVDLQGAAPVEPPAGGPPALAGLSNRGTDPEEAAALRVLPPWGTEPVLLLLPIAHHLGAVSLAGLSVPMHAVHSVQHQKVEAAYRRLGVLLGPHTHTLDIGRSVATVEELWEVVQALPRLQVLCFSLRMEMEAPLRGACYSRN